MWTYINNLDQLIWLAENQKWLWPHNLFSMTRVKRLSSFSIFSFYFSDFLCVESNHSVTLLIPKCVNERISHHMDHDQFEVALQLMVSILDFSTLKPLACWVKISADDILKCFSYFSWKIGFDTLCKLPLKKTICMKCHSLFSWKKISLLSTEFAQRVVKSKQSQQMTFLTYFLICKLNLIFQSNCI